jgi:hypothetical protein
VHAQNNHRCSLDLERGVGAERGQRDVVEAVLGDKFWEPLPQNLGEDSERAVLTPVGEMK